MKELIKRVIQFRDDRNWRIHDTAKDLAISISVESSELLENFQWRSDEEVIAEKLQNVKEELADVVMNCFMLAEDLHIDMEEAILEKLKKNEAKYPIEKAYGLKKKYTEL